ncbi:hypothetical protein W911_09445 [Hyphomicrobium nitrativorans NL23]|uniref:Uncharacterized protein n=1 Tax=Hyphomicrobium nitrativorans NL23 TaxID=1029756 RepID=V5SDF7_9HYPH|nr:hypothetical protein [Hyphomicrobium nitrativorans]AHB48563.1 hypothetical protein W911_09445 [Hyphomicrobium nitrativorans NL23]
MRSADVIAISEPFNGPRKVDADTLIRKVADTLHRLNQQIATAVEAGVTIELMRGSRFHNGRGQWGDQMIPIVRIAETPRENERE